MYRPMPSMATNRFSYLLFKLDRGFVRVPEPEHEIDSLRLGVVAEGWPFRPEDRNAAEEQHVDGEAPRDGLASGQDAHRRWDNGRNHDIDPQVARGQLVHDAHFLTRREESMNEEREIRQ